MALHLVTGGAGFIGSNLVRSLLADGESVRVLDNLSTGKRENLMGLKHVEFIEGDIRNMATCREACRGVNYVYHLAAFISVPESLKNPSLSADINIAGSINMLRAAADAKVDSFVYASSCAVYGPSTKELQREDEPGSPISPYAADKRSLELYAATFQNCFGLPTVGLRFFNVYGPNQDPASPYAAVVPIFMQRMLQGRAVQIHGDGRQTRDFVFVGDVVAANRLAAGAGFDSPEVFNVGTGQVTGVLELATMMREVVGNAPEPEFTPAREGDIRNSRADLTKSGAKLGFMPQVDLREGLTRTVEWLRGSGDFSQTVNQ